MSESSESERDSTPQKAEIEEAQEASFNKKETHEESTPRKADILVDEPSRREETPPPEEELSDHNSGKHPKDPLFSKYGPDKRLVLPDVNKSMMLPTMVRPHKFGKNPNAESQLASGRVGSHRRVVSTSQTRQKLATTSLKHRVAFNANFTSKNSMAKRYFAQNLAQKVQNDFDPNTVYDGIQEIEYELDDLEEGYENMDSTGFEEYSTDHHDEQIEVLFQQNRHLVKKVNAVAEVVAKGISKASNFRSQRLIFSHRELPRDKYFLRKKVTLQKLHNRTINEKRRVEQLKSDISILESSCVVGRDRFRQMKDKNYFLGKEVEELKKRVKFLRRQKKKMKEEKDLKNNKPKVQAKQHELELDLRHQRTQKTNLEIDLAKLKSKNCVLGLDISSLNDKIKKLKHKKHLILNGKPIVPKKKKKIVKEIEEVQHRGEVVNNILEMRERLHEHHMDQKEFNYDVLELEKKYYLEELAKKNETSLKLAKELKEIRDLVDHMKVRKMQQTRNEISESLGMKSTLAVEAGTQSIL